MANFIQITPFIHVVSLQDALDFFTRILGFSVPFKAANYASIEREGVAIRLLEHNGDADAPQPGDRRYAYYIDVRDVDALYAELKPSSIPCRRAPSLAQLTRNTVSANSSFSRPTAISSSSATPSSRPSPSKSSPPAKSFYFKSTRTTWISGICIFQFAGIDSKISRNSRESPCFNGAALTGCVSTYGSRVRISVNGSVSTCGGIPSSFRNSTCTVIPVTVADPAFRTFPSINVDFPPERLVDSLIASSDSGRFTAYAAGGCIPEIVGAFFRPARTNPATMARTTTPATIHADSGIPAVRAGAGPNISGASPRSAEGSPVDPVGLFISSSGFSSLIGRDFILWPSRVP